MKICPKCGEEKELGAFSKKPGGHQSQCKECDHKRYEANKAAILAKQHQYYADNREARIAYSTKYNQEHFEVIQQYAKDWYQENKERIKIQQLEYKRVNADKIKAYRLANQEWLAAYHREYHQVYDPLYLARRPEVKRAAQFRYIGNKKQAIVIPFNPVDIYERDSYTCQVCGKADLDPPHLDHWIPLSLGGPTCFINLRCLCLSCNSSKGAKMPPIEDIPEELIELWEASKVLMNLPEFYQPL